MSNKNIKEKETGDRPRLLLGMKSIGNPCGYKMDRGRDTGYPAPPAQIRNVRNPLIRLLPRNQ